MWTIEIPEDVIAAVVFTIAAVLAVALLAGLVASPLVFVSRGLHAVVMVAAGAVVVRPMWRLFRGRPGP